MTRHQQTIVATIQHLTGKNRDSIQRQSWEQMPGHIPTNYAGGAWPPNHEWPASLQDASSRRTHNLKHPSSSLQVAPIPKCTNKTRLLYASLSTKCAKERPKTQLHPSGISRELQTHRQNPCKLMEKQSECSVSAWKPNFIIPARIQPWELLDQKTT